MSMTLILERGWNKDILHFLQQDVVHTNHPFVMLRVEPEAKFLTLTSTLGSRSNFQVTYRWRIKKNFLTKAWCYKIAAKGLINSVKLLDPKHPIAMKVSEGQIYLQSSGEPDLLGDVNLADNGAKHWLEWVSDEEDRNFEQIPVRDPLIYEMSASKLGQKLITVAQYLKLTPKEHHYGSEPKQAPNLQFTFSHPNAMLHGEASGNMVAITLPVNRPRNESVCTKRAAVSLGSDIAFKVAKPLLACTGDVRIVIMDNQLRIEEKDWSISMGLAEARWNGRDIDKNIKQLPEPNWYELPADKLINVLPTLAVANNPEKEKLTVETCEATNPHEFILSMNQDHVGAMVSVKVAHPFSPDIDISFNYACFEHILKTLSLSSYWAFSIKRRGLVFCNRERSIYFLMSCTGRRRC
ncbi:hypothetical protein LRP52_40865 [Photobacterium sp. ZSDE20]|uniref:Uncharacterized protein n=1 Tax=Photobacterium pectinilyticum TaxID=2906793 RepID=A0ABT1N8D0_9GAMM|nr:hypothetical protein [Photobacterium sp. ZSDE20]MCQ1060797.1 hypothetical protein [Photobacterium sp. ZSDE20]MDD1828537.1 hypothetical protein [Photobacterium sp. ZSDE20]